jgi:exodeoxyribonuclease VII large subunit
MCADVPVEADVAPDRLVLTCRAAVGSSEEPPVYSVADLDRRLKRAVEAAAADVWVEGEVSGAKPATSGHVYFTLKDEKEEASLDCVMYRSASVRSRQLLVDGARVQLRGRATVWAPRGRLQFTAEHARPAGRGSLLEALEALKARLASSGLFAPERKRPLPTDPSVIGVVTSASGAAIHDIAKVAFRRGALRIILSPTLVQGQGAAARVIEALDRLERVAEVEVIIIGRGGGSADDLMVFNDESVVRRVAACRVPVVSAVGHEVDVTLTDLAADARAATPSQAAELLVPDSDARRALLEHTATRLLRAMRARLGEDRATLRELRAGFGRFRFALAQHGQSLDDAAQRMAQAVRRGQGQKRAGLERVMRLLVARHPRAIALRSRGALGSLEIRLSSAIAARVETERAGLGAHAARLDALSPLGVLARGYAIATTDDGRAVRASSEVGAGDRVSVLLYRGRLVTRVESVEPPDPEASS